MILDSLLQKLPLSIGLTFVRKLSISKGSTSALQKVDLYLVKFSGSPIIWTQNAINYLLQDIHVIKVSLSIRL